jgi:hypothetical protein
MTVACETGEETARVDDRDVRSATIDETER